MYLVVEVFQDACRSNIKENASAYWNATLSCPFMGPLGLRLCKFRSRSDLVLDADNALDFFILSRFAGVHLVL